MNKTLLKVTTLILVSASMASAANSIGGSIGSGLSVHYKSDLTETSAVRYGLNLDALNFNFGQVSVGGTVDYLSDLSGQNFGGLSPYYGFGLGAGVGLGSFTGVSIYPHALAGLRYNIVGGPLSVFGELNAGVRISVGSGTGVGVGTGVRIGLDYQLP